MRQHITFSCGDIVLEGSWHWPETTGSAPAVVVCHPHPLYGGSMSANVVFTLCETLARQQVAALRFNFRGVGSSGGEYGGGIEEQEDVKAALALVSTTSDIDPRRVGLAGYSFGASVALPVAVQKTEVSLLALVSPALSDSGQEQLKACPKPMYIISGEHDFIIPPERLQQYVKDIPELKQYEVISGADHFWQGYEAEVAAKVTEFFVAGFNLSSQEPGHP